MIFRVQDNKLYEVDLPLVVDEDKFLEIQKDGKVKFIKVDESNLPSLPENETRIFSKIYYMINEENNIVIDWERTENQWLTDKYNEIQEYIYTYYPQSKQNSDLADKIFYENILKVKYPDKITFYEQVLVNKVNEFFEGKTLEELIQEFPEESKESFLQLLKLGIRVTWVQKCKKELFEAISEKRNPQYPKYPL